MPTSPTSLINELATLAIVLAGLLLMLGAKKLAMKTALAALVIAIVLPFALDYGAQHQLFAVAAAHQTFTVGLGRFVPEWVFSLLAVIGVLALMFSVTSIATPLLLIASIHWLLMPALAPLIGSPPLWVRILADLTSIALLFLLLIRLLFGRRVSDQVLGNVIATYTVRGIDFTARAAGYGILVWPRRALSALARMLGR